MRNHECELNLFRFVRCGSTFKYGRVKGHIIVGTWKRPPFRQAVHAVQVSILVIATMKGIGKALARYFISIWHKIPTDPFFQQNAIRCDKQDWNVEEWVKTILARLANDISWPFDTHNLLHDAQSLPIRSSTIISAISLRWNKPRRNSLKTLKHSARAWQVWTTIHSLMEY